MPAITRRGEIGNAQVLRLHHNASSDHAQCYAQPPGNAKTSSNQPNHLQHLNILPFQVSDFD
jgi:hypothetical protein